MRKAEVYRNGVLAGVLFEENKRRFVFRYDESYYKDDGCVPISLTLPKTNQEFKSEYLFPFFYNMLSEGVNKKLQSNMLKIDEDDSFGLLMLTAKYDTIGAITLKPVVNK